MITMALAGSVLWKVLKYTWPILVLAITFYSGYYVGGARVKAKAESHAYQEIVQRMKAEQKVEEKGKVLKKKVAKSRERAPIDDARDSCLLSGDPFSTRCPL